MRIGGLSTKPEFLVDTAAINAKYAARREDTRRYWTGTTQLSKGMSEGQRNKALYEAAGRFIEAMRKKGWDLYDKVYVASIGTAKDIDTGLPLLDKEEYRIRGVFKLANSPKPVRTELPKDIVKQAPDHTITTAEAVKAWR